MNSYELQISDGWKGRGLGTHILKVSIVFLFAIKFQILESIARENQMKTSLLTVCKGMLIKIDIGLASLEFQTIHEQEYFGETMDTRLTLWIHRSVGTV